MTPQQYQNSLDTNQPLVEFKGELKCIPFYISPQLKQYPFDLLKNLGELPLKIREEEDTLVVLYPGGRLRYIEEDGVLLPRTVRIFGATTEPGKQSLRTEQLDTLIFFEQVKEDEIDPNGEYLHFGDLHLSVELLEGEKDTVKDWWISDKRG